MNCRLDPLRFALPALGIALFAGSLLAADTVERSEADWWLTPRRMIQTNLREIDASMDLDDYVAALDARANVVLFNVGGIAAKHPEWLTRDRAGHGSAQIALRGATRIRALESAMAQSKELRLTVGDDRDHPRRQP